MPTRAPLREMSKRVRDWAEEDDEVVDMLLRRMAKSMASLAVIRSDWETVEERREVIGPVGESRPPEVGVRGVVRRLLT